MLIKYRTQNHHTIYTSISALHVSYISSTHSPSLRRYTFLSHLTTKSKISVRWIKKLVAATYGVYIFIHKLSLSHLYNYSAFTILYAFVRIRNGRHCVSCRHICRSYNLHPHQQRCVYTISPPHITPIIIYPFIFATNAYIICNGGFCESRRHICRS